MAIFFAASTNAFYDMDFVNYDLPRDAREITAELRGTILEECRVSGKIISSCDGLPIAVDPPPRSVEELITSAFAERDQLLREAALRIAPLQYAVDLEEATDAEVALLKKWKKCSVDLNRIEKQSGFPVAISWPVRPE